MEGKKTHLNGYHSFVFKWLGCKEKNIYQQRNKKQNTYALRMVTVTFGFFLLLHVSDAYFYYYYYRYNETAIFIDRFIKNAHIRTRAHTHTIKYFFFQRNSQTCF